MDSEQYERLNHGSKFRVLDMVPGITKDMATRIPMEATIDMLLRLVIVLIIVLIDTHAKPYRMDIANETGSESGSCPYVEMQDMKTTVKYTITADTTNVIEESIFPLKKTNLSTGLVSMVYAVLLSNSSETTSKDMITATNDNANGAEPRNGFTKSSIFPPMDLFA